jgi:hypothetical protein
MGVGPSRKANRAGGTADTLVRAADPPRGPFPGCRRACHAGLSVVASSVAAVTEQQVRGAATVTVGKAVRTSGKRGTGDQGSSAERRCGWCRRVLPQAGSVGRPRMYCGQACRQRAYEQRSATAKAGLSEDVVLVKRAELDGLQDRLFQLRCALEDVQTLLGERHTKAELEQSLEDVVRSTGRLDRLWVTERAG